MPLRLAELFACGALLTGPIGAQSTNPASTLSPDPGDPRDRHLNLAPGDLIRVQVLDLDEISDRPFHVDDRGTIDLPVVGHLEAQGRTPEQLESDIAGRLKTILVKPSVTVSVLEYREEPVTVAGAVVSPGVKQVHGRKNLLEILADAGGLRPEAGPTVRVTRSRAFGTIPGHLTSDPTGQYYLAEFKIRSLLNGENPEENIPIFPHDIVSVPAAEVVYVLGEVAKPGAYELPGAQMSVLDALARAGGAERNANQSHARVLRAIAGHAERSEYQVNINRILAGKGSEFELQPQDILYLPTNKGKVVTNRALEAMIGTGSSIAVFRSAK